ncbi:hypothetical protein OX283_002330 [Flavobacterium sp. SUN052]|uniref:hypothetical protein n=1 Tax=Flavobacterium sp. SUN052 TaxID=3002441 RepID=UPI00237E51B2|nr:hypothetical protein [Flavobacterium sp. SUN052]MEC4003482.1 hypothetical protein [Flavobacterium sp. SUN052]
MNKTKLLTFSVIALLLLNFGILAFLFLSGPNGRKHTPREVVIHKLHFDTNQIADYDKLITVHKEKIKSLNDSIKNCKNELYSQLKTTENKSVTDGLFLKIAQFQSQIEQTHFNHFLDIKKLCKPNQFKDYNELTTKLSEMFQSKQHRQRPERER